MTRAGHRRPVTDPGSRGEVTGASPLVADDATRTLGRYTGPSRRQTHPPLPKRAAGSGASPAAEEEPVASARTTGRRGRVAHLVDLVQRARTAAFGLDQPDAVRRRVAPARWAFGVSVAFYVTYELLTRGRMILGGSMWAEMGTNYYPAATSGSLGTQLFTTDAGYLPLPQRLIGLVGHAVGVPVSAIPYYFTGAALVCSGLLIGSVCLPAFRPVISSDALRFVLALALMVLPDFETRIFVNFTYFGVVFAAFTTALALVSRARAVPWWSWAIPLLMVSKPGVLAVLPAMVVVGVISGRGRFRRVAIAAVVGGAVQLVELARSAASGASLLQGSDASALSKLSVSVKYTVGLLGRMLLGPGQGLGVRTWMAVGVVLVLVALAAAAFLRSTASGLVLIGLSMALCTMVIDSFTFSAFFTRDMHMLAVPVFDRRYLVALVGMFFVMAGLISAITGAPRLHRVVARVRPAWSGLAVARGAAAVGVVAFAAWFVSADWMDYTAGINQPLGLPVGDVSQWTEMAPELASTEPVVCVPLDPFGWVYGRNCEELVGSKVTPAVFGWAELPDTVEGRPAVTLEAPSTVHDGDLASLALMVRPPGGSGTRNVSAEAVVTTDDGRTRQLYAAADLDASGGLLQFNQSPVAPLRGVRSVTLVFDGPATVGSAASEDATKADVLWMGQPRG